MSFINVLYKVSRRKQEKSADHPSMQIPQGWSADFHTLLKLLYSSQGISTPPSFALLR